jgi:cyclophilin family peptidyl-prolyl cis-trans isomerase
MAIYANITMESGKKIRLKLDPDNAPKTVKNFTDLAEAGFYNGLISTASSAGS